MSRKAGKHNSSSVSKPQKGKKGKKNMSYSDISEDEVDKFYNQREKIMLEETDEEDSGDLSFGEEAILDLPTESEGEDEEYSEQDVLYDGEEDDDEEKWGRSKKAFYSADKEALEEEASEAKRLQKKRLGSMKMTDFTGGKAIKIDGKKKTDKGPISLDFDDEEGSSGSEVGQSEGHFEESEPDESADEEFNLDRHQVANLSAEEKIKLLENHSEEFKSLMFDFKEKLGFLEGHLGPLMAKLEGLATSEGLEFLKVKYQLLTGYCTNVAFYLQLKLRGKPIMDHPVLEKLVKFRLLLEKIKPMEAKLKNQVNRLLQAAAGQLEEGEDEATAFRPNPEMLLKGDEGSENDNDDKDDQDGNDGLYKVPRLAPVHYPEDENAAARRKKHEERIRKSNASSQLVKELRAEFDDAPDEEALDVVYGGKGRSKSHQLSERNQYEEDNYIRFTLDKKAKQKLREQTAKPIDELEDLNDFVHELGALNKTSKKPSKSISKIVGKKRASETSEQEDDFEVTKFGKGNRPQSQGKQYKQGLEDESDIEDDLQDDFYSKAKAAKQAKKELKARPVPKGPVRFRSINDLGEDSLRPANWKMMKNKGLTVNRPKETRNPRVKQRKRFEKAEKRLGSFRAVNKTPAGKYSGEETGIRTNIKRSVNF